MTILVDELDRSEYARQEREEFEADLKRTSSEQNLATCNQGKPQKPQDEWEPHNNRTYLDSVVPYSNWVGTAPDVSYAYTAAKIPSAPALIHKATKWADLDTNYSARDEHLDETVKLL